MEADPLPSAGACGGARRESGQAKQDAEVQRRVEHLATLAAACQQFITEQEATKKAREVARNTDTVLGTAASTEHQQTDDVGERSKRMGTVLAAYRDLARDVPDDA